MAMSNGIPSFFTEPSLSHMGNIKNIENPKIDYKIFNNLAYGQWTLKEIESGETWESLSKKLHIIILNILRINCNIKANYYSLFIR